MSTESEISRSIARVAKVLDEFRVVINQGALDGVKVGQSYQFFALGQEIFDPETRESLGQLEEIRGIGKVIHAQERMSIIYSSKQRPKYDGRASSSFTDILAGRLTPTSYEDLPFDSIVQGDYARRV